jgi:amino acid adenylation domain-containing protein
VAVVTTARIPPVFPLAPGAPRPLSYAQERLWFLHHLEGAADATVTAAWRFAGPLDVDALSRALTAVLDRHPVLRTVFPDVDGVATAQVRPVEPIRLDSQWSSEPDLADGFDLAVGPLVRVRLVRSGPDEQVLALAAHRIVFDAPSARLFIDDLLSFYQGATPPPLPIGYADHAGWQRDWLHGGDLDASLSYWTGRLAGAPLQLALPADRPRDGRYEGGRCQSTVDTAVLVRRIADAHGVAPEAVALAAFCVLLYRYTGQSDLVVGVPADARLTPESAGLIGCFANPLALRVRVDPDATVADLLRNVHAVLVEDREHDETPFEKVVEAVSTGPALDHHPLIQVMLVWRDDAAAPVRLPGLDITTLHTPSPAPATLDVVLSLGDGGSTVDYNAALFDPATIQAMTEVYGNLLTGFAENPQWTVADVPVGRVPVPAELSTVETSLVDLFEARVAATPSAPAVIGTDEVLDWATVERRSGAVARWLIERGVRPGDAVGLSVGYGVAVPVAIWGILRAGAAYVPLDPHDPPERLARVAADAGVRVTVTDLAVVGDAVPDQYPRIGPGQRAYVLFTSGSTGRPKGVEVAHRNVVAYLSWLETARGLGPSDRMLGYVRPGFDLSVPELLGPAVWGGAIVMAAADRRTDPGHLLDLMVRHEVTTIFATSTVLSLLAEPGTLSRCRSLRYVVAGGEPVPMALLRKLRAQTPARLDVHYGPTEATVFVTSWTFPGDDVAVPAVPTAPVGVPIDGCQVHVLDAAMRPVPPGAVGELYLGGRQVALGYVNNPALTAAAFVPDPWQPGARLYRTGDLGRLRGDGLLEFLGRTDRQIKANGMRIELGEIEAALADHPAVTQAVVVAQENRLVAVVTGDAAVGADLREHAAARLPSHMVPAALVWADAIPRNANGKTDHAALRALLPTPDALALDDGAAAEPPRTPTEERLAELFAEVLGTPVGVHANFFAAGGHSLLGVRLMSGIRRLFGVELPLRVLFEASTVAALARRVEDAMLAAAGGDLLRDLLAALDQPE